MRDAGPLVDVEERLGEIEDLEDVLRREGLDASVQMRTHEEASPNLPGVSASVERPRAVTVRFLNDQGEIEDRDFVGLWATSVQHQIDHLNGRMYVDRLSPLKRRMLIARSEKLRRAA